MSKPKYILILILAFVIGILEKDCTFALVFAMVLIPEIFKRKGNCKKVKADD